MMENINMHDNDPNSFIRVTTDAGKWIELYWVGDQLTLRGNADLDEAAKLFFDKVEEYGTSLRAAGTHRRDAA